MNTDPSAFWQTQPGLVWSNPAASDSVHIRKALLRPRFQQLLKIAVQFGVARLREEWKVLEVEGTGEAQRARSTVERILRHIEEGAIRATTGN